MLYAFFSIACSLIVLHFFLFFLIYYRRIYLLYINRRIQSASGQSANGYRSVWLGGPVAAAVQSEATRERLHRHRSHSLCVLIPTLHFFFLLSSFSSSFSFFCVFLRISIADMLLLLLCAVPADPRRVIVVKLSIMVEGRAPLELDLKGIPSGAFHTIP